MINHIYQDSKGYIWVSTEDGLNKYDGAKFVNYKNHFNDSTSLLGNHVYKTFQDSKGYLYVLSTKGLQFYDYKSDSFITIKKSNSSSEYNNKSITQLSDGSILIGTSGYGIKELSYNENKNIRIKDWNPSLTGHNINDIMEDRNGNIWICTTKIKKFITIQLEHPTEINLSIVAQKIQTAIYMWVQADEESLFTIRQIMLSIKYFILIFPLKFLNKMRTSC